MVVKKSFIIKLFYPWIRKFDLINIFIKITIHFEALFFPCNIWDPIVLPCQLPSIVIMPILFLSIEDPCILANFIAVSVASVPEDVKKHLLSFGELINFINLEI